MHQEESAFFSVAILILEMFPPTPLEATQLSSHLSNYFSSPEIGGQCIRRAAIPTREYSLIKEGTLPSRTSR